MTTIAIISVGGPAGSKVVVDVGGATVEHWPGQLSTYDVAAGMRLSTDALTVPNIPCVFKLTNDSGGAITAACDGDTGVSIADSTSVLLVCDGTGVSLAAGGIPGSDGITIQSSGRMNVGTDNAAGAADSFDVSVYSGDTESGNSGPASLFTGSSSAGNTGQLSISSGDASAGDSGDVLIASGTATGTRGHVKISGVPTSASGLATGTLWNNSGTPAFA